jgi:hypothetical protein
MPQTTYSNYHSASIAGQVVDGMMPRGQRGRYDCSENLNFGCFVELHTDGQLRHPQTAGATGNIMGAVPYNPSLAPTLVGGTYVNGYAAGAHLVPAFRRGQMWVPYVGAAPAAESRPNIKSSSTIATDRGKVTADATSAVAGSEVYAAPDGVRVIKTDATTSLALVEFNLPA